MKKYLLLVVSMLTMVISSPVHGFSDTKTALYSNAIEYVQQEGIVQGYTDGTFRPESTMNRAELTKIVVEARYGKEIEKTKYDLSCFHDVPVGAWFTPYVCFAKEKEIVRGYEDGTFRPEATVNFVESLKILSETFGRAIRSQEGEWFRVYIDNASEDNLLPIDIRSFDAPLKRGQMAEMTARFLVLEKSQTEGLRGFLGERWGQRTTYQTIKEGRIPARVTANTEDTRTVSAPQDPREEATNTSEQWYTVVRVVDGNTLVVSDGSTEEKVRLIGIDTPEVVHPEKPVECFGREASAYAKAILEQRVVRLEADPTQTDRDVYGRLLRYVYLQDGSNVGATLLRHGYANEYTYRVPYEQQEEYKSLAKESMAQRKGLWADNACIEETQREDESAQTEESITNAQDSSSHEEPMPIMTGVVKLSTNGICHEPGSTYYSRTKNYTPYATMEECLNAGGRRPKR